MKHRPSLNPDETKHTDFSKELHRTARPRDSRATRIEAARKRNGQQEEVKEDNGTSQRHETKKPIHPAHWLEKGTKTKAQRDEVEMAAASSRAMTQFHRSLACPMLRPAITS